MKITLPFLKALTAFVLIVATAPQATAQLVSGEVFIQGSYVETALASNGAFGSVNAAPSGYHARSGSGGLSKSLGFVADPDKDGWTVGTPAFFGDYFLAQRMGECQEGWRVQIGTNIYEAWRGYGGISMSPGISGSNTDYTSIGTTRAGTWEGSIGNLRIKQVTSLDASQVFVVVNVSFVNTGSTTLSNVYYERDVNPENENNVVSGSDFYNTDNRIEFKLPNAKNKTLVSATGRTYGAYMGIGSKDCRAKGFISNNYDPTLTPANTYAETGSYTYAVSTVANQDYAIGIVYQLGNIAAGDSTTLSFAYVLKAADLDSAFAQVQHGFTHNVTNYQSKDTVKACPGTNTISVSNPGGYSWTWSPATGLSTTTGPVVSVSVGAATTTYRVIGTSLSSACGTYGKDTIYLTVQPATVASPVVVTPVTYCQGATASALTASGTGLKWYTGASGGTGSSTAPTPSTTTAGTTTYYVSQTSALGCESNRSAIDVVVNATPANPGVTTPVTYCQGATASVLTATGTGLNWYSDPTGGTGSSTAPAPSTVTAGITTYYVSQTSALGCESGRSTIVVTVNALPAKPAVTTPVTYCQNATPSALTATGSGLLWYTVASGGTGAATAPTPSTATAGTTTYYVTQNSAATGCTSLRAAIDVVVNATPDSPLVTTPVVYCLNATATALIATGSSLKWYTAATGGIGSTTAPTPSTTSSGNTSYYVSQTSALGCESKRSRIMVTVNALPAKPAVTTPVTYCQNATAIALTATGTSLLWYTVSTGGTGSATAPTPSTATVGTTTYYVTQTVAATGCTSLRASIDVVVNALPAAPTVSTPVNLCQGVSAVAFTATGTSLLWYTGATGGAGSSTAPVPPTLSLGTTSYYVSQTNALGCEGPRAEIIAVVNAIPATPSVVTPVDLCIGVMPAALSATGTNLKWYTTASGGTGSATAIIPDVSVTGGFHYYVSQTSLVGCESPRATINTTVHPSPAVTLSTPYAPDFVYCEGATVILKANAATAISYQWKKAGTDIPGETYDTTVVGTNGNYSVLVTDIYGCQTTKTAFVFKDTLPKPSLSPTNVQMCRGVNIMLYCSPSHAGYTYLWSKDGLPMEDGVVAAVPMSETGSYEVTVTDFYGCTSTTNVATISAYPAITKPTIIRYDKTLRLSASYTSQQWYRNKTAISGATASSYTISFDGMYYAQVYDANGCTTMSDTIYAAALGIPGVNGNQPQLSIYPNPAQSKVIIETSLDKIQISVTDVTGREVLRRQDVKEMDLGDLADGMYLISITDSNGLPIGIEKIHKLSRQ